MGGLKPAALPTATALTLLSVLAWLVLLVSHFTDRPPMPVAAVERAGMGGEEVVMAGPSMNMGSSLGEPLGAALFVGAWLVMMAAMMLPSAVPMVSIHRVMAAGSAASKAAQSALFVSAYLVAWGGFGLGVYLLQQSFPLLADQWPGLASAWPVAVAAILVIAGAYQLSPLKDLCLRHCRSPLSFLMERWRSGLWGSFRLGLRHGLYCIGCCWGLMAVLVVAGAMGLVWVALIGLAVFAEKLLPAGRAAARTGGASLAALGALIALRPEVAWRLAM